MTGGWSTACNAVYWLALTVWTGVLVAAAAAATAAFSVLPHLGIVLRRFGALDGAEHGRIAAGKMMDPLFAFVDLVQLVAGAVVLITAALQCTVFRCPLRRPANLLRLATIALAAGSFLYRAAALTPAMNRELHAYWTAAEAGEIEEARMHRAAFDAAHPRASDLFSATLALLVITVLATPAALAVAADGTALQVPALTRRPRL